MHQAYLDCLATLERYFGWSDMSNEKGVQFAIWNLLDKLKFHEQVWRPIIEF